MPDGVKTKRLDLGPFAEVFHIVLSGSIRLSRFRISEDKDGMACHPVYDKGAMEFRCHRHPCVFHAAMPALAGSKAYFAALYIDIRPEQPEHFHASCSCMQHEQQHSPARLVRLFVCLPEVFFRRHITRPRTGGELLHLHKRVDLGESVILLSPTPSREQVFAGLATLPDVSLET